jgi:hypothetical protein
VQALCSRALTSAQEHSGVSPVIPELSERSQSNSTPGALAGFADVEGQRLAEQITTPSVCSFLAVSCLCTDVTILQGIIPGKALYNPPSPDSQHSELVRSQRSCTPTERGAYWGKSL